MRGENGRAPHRLLFRKITRSAEDDDGGVLLELHAPERKNVVSDTVPTRPKDRGRKLAPKGELLLAREQARIMVGV
jgi:hypothetical protein